MQEGDIVKKAKTNYNLSHKTNQIRTKRKKRKKRKKKKGNADLKVGGSSFKWQSLCQPVFSASDLSLSLFELEITLLVDEEVGICVWVEKKQKGKKIKRK